MFESYIESILKPLVDYPDQLVITKTHDDMGVMLSIKVSQADMGKVVGREGSTAKCIRHLAHALGMKNHVRISIKILEPDGSTHIPKQKSEVV